MENASTGKKLPFKVSARTAKLIGLENFTNEEGAVIELVKNTYDADAINCVLIFDFRYKLEKVGTDDESATFDKNNSKIYIIDNGVGMTDQIIANQWMTIGTDDKLYDHTTYGGRVKTGAKGIGRFALNRLGLVTNLLTLSSETLEGWEWLVDWRDFDKLGASVSDVEAILSAIPSLNLLGELHERFSEQSHISTAIDKIDFASGTIIEISELNDDWDEEKIGRLFSNLEILLPPKEQSGFFIDLFVTNMPAQFGRVKSAYYDDYDYKVEAVYDNTDEGIVTLSLTRNELDIGELKERYSEVFDYPAMKVFPFRLEDFQEKTLVIEKPIRSLLSSDVDKQLISKLGAFRFTYYYLKNTVSDDKADGDTKKYPYKGFNSANRRAWLRRFGGVKIFRDNFRVRPYGENGEDWLKLGERQSQSPGGAGQRLGGYRIRPNQIAGTIQISRLNNLSFQDKSGREGIIENDVFELFKNVAKELISFFEKDRNTVMFYLSELYKKKNKEEEARRKAQEEAERIAGEEEQRQQADEDEENRSNNEYSDREKVLAVGVNILTKENDRKDEEIRLLRSLASVGLIISSFAHEVKSLRARLIPRTTHLITELRLHLSDEALSHVPREDNPYYLIGLMKDEDTKLKHWLDYSLNTLKRDKRERTNLNFKDYFEKFRATWLKALEQRKIQLILEGRTNDCIIRAFEVDMDSIFNNLLSNSLGALKGHRDTDKQILIGWKKVGTDVIITFQDNGNGLDQQYRENPNQIFNLNESSKKDKTGNVIGTGLGLYIVRSIVEEYNHSTVTIGNFINGLEFILTFKTRS